MTFTATPSPTPTVTPEQLCWVYVQNVAGVNIRREANIFSDLLLSVPQGTALRVVGLTTGGDNHVWYEVVVETEDGMLRGWVRSDVVEELTACPAAVP